MSTSKYNFTKLLDKLDWVSSTSNLNKQHPDKFSEFGIGFAFQKVSNTTKGAPANIGNVTIRFTHARLKSLGWDLKDKICIYHDPDDVFNLKLIKSQNGYKLGGTVGVLYSQITFKWPYDKEVPLQLKKMAETQDYMQASDSLGNKYILLRLSQ